MPYNNRIFKKASGVIAERKRIAEEQLRLRHDNCVLLFPEIASLEKEMASSALAVTKALEMKDGAQDYVKKLMNTNLSAQDKIRKILKENGFPEDYLQAQYSCAKCGDTGFAGNVMCECLKDCMKNIALCEISDKLPIDKYTFENFDLSYYPSEKDSRTSLVPKDKMKNVFSYCRDYAENFEKHGDSLLFSGGTGLGKTHLSLAIAGKVIGKGYSVIYGSAQNLLNMLENEKFGRSELDYSVEQSILNCDLLILDDLGSEFSTQFTVSAIYNIVNSRLLERKPVIISTNLEPKELEAKYSSRITSRIYGNYRHLLFVGRDIRQIKSQY